MTTAVSQPSPAASPAAAPATAARAAVWRRVLPHVAGIAGLSLLIWLVYGSGYVDYDTVYALSWGRDIAHGHAAADFASVHSPTSHPLDTLLCALLTPLGAATSLKVLQAISVISLAGLGWAAFNLGRRLFVPAVGVVFALILLTRPILVSRALSANVDVPFLALVLAAAALEAARPRRGAPVLVLLALAGLLRPEAWVLSVAYVAWLWPARDVRGRASAVGLALAGPLLWGAFDLVVAGSPLHSFTGTRDAATRIHRPQGVVKAVRLTPSFLARFLQVIPFLLALAAGAAALYWERRRALLPAAIGVLGVGAFLVLGLGSQPLLPRYVALPGAMLALFLAAAVGAHFIPSVRERFGGLATAVSLVALAALVVAGIQVEPNLRKTVNVARAEHDADANLPAFVDGQRAAFKRCPPAQTAFFQTRPLLAFLLGDHPNAVVNVRPSTAVSGALLIQQRSAKAPPPRTFRLVAANGSWRLLTTCGSGA